MSNVKGVLSEPLLPTKAPGSPGSQSFSGRPPVQKKPNPRAMSYPFTQQEMIADAMIDNELQRGEIFQTFEKAAHRFDFAALSETFAAGVALREAAVFQRVRQTDMVVPTEGPSWQQAAVTIATTLIGAGVLGLPYAMRKVGWLGFIIISWRISSDQP